MWPKKLSVPFLYPGVSPFQRTSASRTEKPELEMLSVKVRTAICIIKREEGPPIDRNKCLWAGRRNSACKDSWELQNSSPKPTIGALSPVELKPASAIFDVLIQIQIKQDCLHFFLHSNFPVVLNNVFFVLIRRRYFVTCQLIGCDLSVGGITGNRKWILAGCHLIWCCFLSAENYFCIKNRY